MPNINFKPRHIILSNFELPTFTSVVHEIIQQYIMISHKLVNFHLLGPIALSLANKIKNRRK